MPKIEIREKDLTSAGSLSTTTIATYIPGYANMGPINKPILCSTVEEFQSIFGSSPYKFRNAQYWGVGTGDMAPIFSDGYIDQTSVAYQVGDYEKSYIMAIGLLSAGMPVWYERVFSGDTSTWTPSYTADALSTTYFVVDGGTTGDARDDVNGRIKISAKYPGLVGEKIYFYITKKVVYVDSSNTGVYYEIYVGMEESQQLGVSSIGEVKTSITFDYDVSKKYKGVRLVSSTNPFDDESGLATIQITFGDSVEGTIIPHSIYDEDAKKYKKVNLGFSTRPTNDEFCVGDMYKYLSNKDNSYDVGYERLEDKGEFVLKFLTSGAYPTNECSDYVVGGDTYKISGIALRMMKVAANRGDCTALIDHSPANERPLVGNNSVYANVSGSSGLGGQYNVNEFGEESNTFAAMFTPYGIYNTIYGDQMLPASYGYLVAHAAQAQFTNAWVATAGVNRGRVPGLIALCQNLTNAIADSYQPRGGVAINPITNIKPYGLVLWGSRTLKNNVLNGDLTATSFLNIRQLTNDVKRQVYVAAKSLTFEQNNDLLWIKFKNKLTPLLDSMVNSGGISAYDIKKKKTDKKATIKAVVRLYAIEPVEDWDITIELADSTTEILG